MVGSMMTHTPSWIVRPRIMLAWCASATVLAGAPGAHAQPAEPVVEFRRPVAAVPGEVAMAASTDGRQVVVATNFPNGVPAGLFDDNTIFFSRDGGATFLASAIPPELRNRRDPALTRGPRNSFYFAAMGGRGNVVTGRSADGGATFNQGGRAAECANVFPAGAVPCTTDQPHLAANPTARRGQPDALYLVWRGTPDDFATETAFIECSLDEGRTWVNRRPIDALGKGQFPRLTVDTLGRPWTVMVDRRRTGSILVQRFSPCSDGLRPQLASPANATAFNNNPCDANAGRGIAGLDRCNSGNTMANPTIAVDPDDPATVFVTWAQGRGPVTADILTVIDRAGGSGGFPERIALSQPGIEATRYLPTSCAMKGRLVVSWYDRRGAPQANNALTQFFFRVLDTHRAQAPLLSQEVRLTDTPDDACATWPNGTRHPETAEACTAQPQRAGFLRAPPAGVPDCDFSDAGAGCSTGPGIAKYGDYNGIACEGGTAWLPWASHVAPARGIANAGRAGNLATYLARVDLGVCGDGIRNLGEQCDTGGATPRCDALCQVRRPAGELCSKTGSLCEEGTRCVKACSRAPARCRGLDLFGFCLGFREDDTLLCEADGPRCRTPNQVNRDDQVIQQN